MKKKTNRLLSILLTLVMVLSMLPAVTPHVHAAGTGEVQLIGPSGIAISSEAPPDDYGYTNEDLLAFYLNTGGTYTLTTNGTSTNAVSLLVNTTDDITVVLDNVSFDVVQPKRSSSYYQMLNDYTAEYNPSAIEIVQADSSLTVNVELKIKGVNDLKAAAKTVTTSYEPAVLQLTGVNTVISGYDSGDNVLNIRNGTVEGTTFSPNGICATNDLTLGSGVTYNIGDYSNKDANLFIGNTAVSAENLVIADGAVVNVGIDNPNSKYAICLAGKKKIEAATVNLRVTYGTAIYGTTEIGDGAVLTAVSEDYYAINVTSKNPLVIGDNATVSLTSNSNNYSAVNLDNNTSFSVGENSKVTINSRSENNDWAVFTDGASVSVGSGSEVTVNSGYGGLYCNDVTLAENAKLIVHAKKQCGINLCSNSITVGAGATLHVNSDADYGIYATNTNAKIYLNSGNVLVHGKVSAFYLYSSNKDFFVRGITSDEEITTYYSSDDKTWEEQDNVSWTAFAEGQIAAQWFKTVSGPHTHVYTNGYEYEADKHHYGICACGTKSAVAENCTYPDGYYNYYPRPTATTDGTRTWKCSVCKGYWYETIPAHNCADYVNEWEDYGSATQHKGVCAYLVEASGNTCGIEVYAGHTFTEWSGDSLTVSRTCTGCGYVESKSTHENVTHMEAIAGDCSQPGRIEFWHCTDSDCGLYFSDALMTQVVAPEDTFTTPGAHNYGADGVCTVCGDKKTTVTFIEYEDNNYYSDMDGELFILVGFKDGKAYVMGNETNADGSRNAVEIPVKANGAIDADSATAEFFAFDFDEATLSPDGGYMTMLDGKIVVYDKARVDEDGLPKPIIFSQNSSYSDETGYLLNWTNDWCIVFDAETLTFKVTDTPADSIIRYKQVCSHENLHHTSAAEATCTEQGAVEYWYCDECYGYFMNHDFEKPVEIDNESELTKKATGHKFDADGICENCGMKRHVYTQVSTLAEFDALSEDASYIIVFKDGDKTYAAYYPDVNAFDQMVSADSDGDGVVDLLETDANANGVPDIIENYIDTQWSSVDYNEDGVKSAEEYNEAIGSYDEDEDVDIEDYKLFFSYNVEDWLYDEFWEENAINHLNIVEVTVASDGSITVTDEGAMEFQMMVGGVWGNQEYDEYDFEYFGIKDTERMRAAWIPNYWIGASGQMGCSGEEHFMTQERYYGDGEYPGIQDHHNWKISFREDRTACLVNSWTDLEDTGALQLAKYGEGKMTIVGLPEWQWEYSDIMLNRTALLPAYLYASEPTYAEPPHECIWGPWEDDDVTDTHTRKCTVEGCDKKQTEDHNWDDGVQTSAPSCTEPGTILYTCPDCNATKTEPIDALDHDWSEWVYDSVDSHIRHCKRDGCDAEEYGGHEWGNWMPVDDNTHKMTCSICKGYQTEEHDWDDGVVTKEPTELEEGVKTYTCGLCSHTKTEPVDKLVHECVWTDWYPNGDENHKRDCMDDNCGKFETLPHEWDNGEITKEPTCKETGVKTYTCQTCMHTRTEDVPTTDHVFGDWTPNNDGTTHSRYCSCNESETTDHKFDDGVVTEQPTHVEPGIKTYTCADCGYSYEEDIPVLTDHAWGEWVINKLDEANTHIRYCICDESQTAPHNFDEGVVTEPATHTSKGVKTYTCTDDCGYSYTEEIPETTEHQWTNWSPNDDGTHTRSCRCNATETKPCEWDDGVVTAPTCTEEGKTVYTCTACGNTKAETEPALDHDWGDWIDTGANAPADIHERSCKRDGCDAKETGNHEWSSWASAGSSEHKKTCSVCKGERTAIHAWDNGVETKAATVKETGARKYTCFDCGATKTEVIPKIVCDHTWGKWEAENDETHKRTCVNGNGCEAFQRQAHEWDNGVVTTEPTETAEGAMTYTCLICNYEKVEAIAMLEHTHSFGRWASDGADTHTRRCENGNTCTAAETEAHTCDTWEDNGNNHVGACAVCDEAMTEAHAWSDWTVGTTENTYIRSCKCGATEEMTVQNPISDAVVNTTDSEANDANAELVVEKAEELFNSVLTNDEQAAVAAGNTTVSVYLEVEDIPVNEVSASDKAAAEAVIEEEDNDLDETTVIGVYLDINLFKEVTTTTEETSGSTTTTTTETEASQVTETSNKVTITIEIPDDLINDDASVERIYRIIRVHEDENGNVITDVIEGIFDSVNKTFTFETDKFSTYALAYNDTEKAVTTYTVTYTDGVDGVVVFADQTFTVEAGKATPTISNPTRSGYTFKGWNPSVVATVTGNVTYTATWQKNSSGGYIPSVPTFTPSVEETVGGDTTVDKKYPEQGDKVTITADPDKGYEVDEVIVTDRNGNKVEVIDNGDGTYSFKQPYGKVTITVTYVPEQVGFVDVEENSYYYDAVNWAVANGITNGTSDTTFSPNASCTRAQMVTFLWRAAGCPEPKTTVCPFADVDMDSYYGKAVLWAIENGITNGTSATTFGPDAACTRAQMAAFLCRMAGGKAVSSTGAFADVKADAYYAEAVQWAVENGVTNGTGEGKFSPDAICTRGQMVTFLYRYFVK